LKTEAQFKLAKYNLHLQLHEISYEERNRILAYQEISSEILKNNSISLKQLKVILSKFKGVVSESEIRASNLFSYHPLDLEYRFQTRALHTEYGIQEKERVYAEKARVDAEKARVDSEKARVDAEKASEKARNDASWNMFRGRWW
jgi:hypothetical protein